MGDRNGIAAKFLLLTLLTGFILTVQYLLYPMCPGGCSWMLLSPSYLPSLPSLWLSNWFYADPAGILWPTLASFIMVYVILAYFLSWKRLRRLLASLVFGLAFILPFLTAIVFEYMGYSLQMSGISGITSAMIGAATVYAVTWHHLSDESDTDLSIFTVFVLFGIFASIF
ncbi:MAG: hypothetical protein SVU32_08060, partial [Candidatus Nanohaloarchaea archaeon]|nr:hypothetical protein [Candidatus Nanohaloarchaea archaeon]